MALPRFKRETALQPKEAAIIVVDMQIMCAVPGKGLHSHFDENSIPDEYQYFFSRLKTTTIPAIKSLLVPFRKEQNQQRANVIHTYIECLTHDCRDQSLDYKLSGFYAPKGHPDNAIIDELKPMDDDISISKTSCSVFNSTNIEYVLRNLGVSQLVITGILSNQCVESAVRDAADRGFYVHVPEDAIAANNDYDHEQAVKNMAAFARITTTNELISEIASWNA